ncbi:MAG: hypothetical protein RL238_2839 [Actinomycetota bacterium]|jgi:integrase
MVGESALPANARWVALYVTALASTCKPSTLSRRLAAISVAHQRAGFPSPTAEVYVREVMKGIRRAAGTAPAEARPLLIGDVRRICARLGGDRQAVRDRAILLVGFAGALRRSEIVALNVEDLSLRNEGIVLSLRRSKTDQEGEGRLVALKAGRDPETCPVTAIAAWIEASDITEGPLFRSVNRHGTVGQRLSAQSVTTIVRRAVQSIGLDPTGYSGHSLRAGFATTAAANGASERAIANQTGHRSMSVLRRYVRHGSLFTDNAVTALGL